MGDYWDIDAILADTQRVPAIFNDAVPGYGHLEGNGEPDLTAGVKVEIPFWYIATLAHTERIDLLFPSCYGRPVLMDLTASPLAVNLAQLSPYYYKLAMLYLDLIVDDMLPSILEKTFRERMQQIARHGVAMGRGDTTQSLFLNSLESIETERKSSLFWARTLH
ncbi:hypothetical protein CXG81DRAFT_15714 [Caulochytrium protostelioides]|uniref:DNA replication complex GINS protein PSF3 n=1 Tax=Caulochytrium protostelioides TaxID=1555241 RepID=A0A4V1ITX7_9FUNG|nr:hypothetical protein CAUPRSCDRAFT_5990 [Caulochytrium protostelioides]RKO98597.1 hypothetical protein CXG81DRAFT_15714 [Caulochytrium protostelioides]|eukprot:RKO98597.1 hypothetical protein CXG81DRAFT_15714 [Caulochytrium protostelioides]